ncbi:MAG: tetratricopeptide repeat protein, partial [Bacteroidales bacterium]|nr:tetratricopeptide repeat protein [Bacteroidales bacterium]
MTPILLIPCDITQWIDENTLAFISIIVGVIGIFITILSIVGVKITLPHTRKWRRNQIDEIPNDFDGYYPNKNFIQPYFTFIDTESGDSAEHRLRDFFLKEVFVKNSTKPTLYCLLGDTGTGKTAALVHLYADYINCHSAKSNYQIKILSLRQEEVFDNINNIQDKRHCILLLDAIDENPMAQDPDHRDDFDKEINNICRDFAFVVLTCRPQFFSNDNDESNQVETRIGDHQWLRYTRLKLSDFNTNQVQEYLDKVFTFRSDNELRQKAEKIVNKHALIAIRPLVLNYIREIVKSEREINTTLDFYDTIVQKQIQRELERISPRNLEKRTQQWWDMTSEVAGYIYRKTNGTTKEKAITIDELQNIFHDNGNEELTHYLSSLNIALPHKKQEETQFLQRSLLTRTGDSFHFSHQSFYEYFIAYRFLLHPYDIKQVRGIDFALTLYDELFDAYHNQRHDAYHNQRQKLVADFSSISDIEVADSLYNVGCELQDINNFSKAKDKYEKALTIRRQLAAQNPDAYLPYVAMTLNNLAVLHSDTNQLQEAEEEYNEALSIRRQLADKNPDAYLPDVAMILNNLANLYSVTNQLEKAEEEYNEALTIRRQLADKNPDAYLPRVADTLNNLGLLHSDTNQLDKAEEEYNEALNTYRQLAEKNPDSFLPYLAGTLNNLAVLHYNTKRYNEAEEEYNEALTIRRQLANKNPDAYLPDVAQTLYNLANLHSDTNQLDNAEKEYNEALTIRRQLADKNPDAFLPHVAKTLNNLAILHSDTNQLDKA